MLLPSIFTFFFCIATASSSAPQTCSERSNLPLYKLYDDVFCNYDSKIRPVKKHTENVTVNFVLIARSFGFDHFTDTLTLDSWLHTDWEDEHLKWNPSDYDNINSILVPTSDIWIPDLSLLSRTSESGSAELISDCKCIVVFIGQVTCVCPSHLSALCRADLSRFPFDSQTCLLTFGSWYHTGEQLHIRPLVRGKEAIAIDEIEENGEWDIAKATTAEHSGHYESVTNSTFPVVLIELQITRLSGSHTTTIITPFFVAIILTLVSLCISVESKERLRLCYLNLLIQFLHLQNIMYQIPMHGRGVPHLLSFGKDSLYLCVFATIFSLCFKRLAEKREAAPTLVSSVVSFVYSSRISVIISANSARGHSTLEEDKEDIIENANKAPNKDWAVFVLFLDRILFIIYIFVYVIMVISWL